MHLLESPDHALLELRNYLVLEPGSEEFDDDPTGPDDEEDDDDSSEFA